MTADETSQKIAAATARLARGRFDGQDVARLTQSPPHLIPAGQRIPDMPAETFEKLGPAEKLAWQRARAAANVPVTPAVHRQPVRGR